MLDDERVAFVLVTSVVAGSGRFVTRFAQDGGVGRMVVGDSNTCSRRQQVTGMGSDVVLGSIAGGSVSTFCTKV